MFFPSLYQALNLRHSFSDLFFAACQQIFPSGRFLPDMNAFFRFKPHAVPFMNVKDIIEVLKILRLNVCAQNVRACTSIARSNFWRSSDDFMHQMRAQLRKNPLISGFSSPLAASSAQLNPPASAMFSETTSLPLHLPASVSRPSNSSIISCARPSKCFRSSSVHQLERFPNSSN